jgi:hypothetical protein
VFAGARIEGNARLTGTCVVSHPLLSATMYGSTAAPSAITRLSVTTSRFSTPAFAASAVSRPGAHSPHCLIIAAQGLTADRDKFLQIYQRATVSASRIVHQAQIYGDAFVEHAFVEHRAEIFDMRWKVTKRTMSGSAITPESTTMRA